MKGGGSKRKWEKCGWKGEVRGNGEGFSERRGEMEGRGCRVKEDVMHYAYVCMYGLTSLAMSCLVL